MLKKILNVAFGAILLGAMTSCSDTGKKPITPAEEGSSAILPAEANVEVVKKYEFEQNWQITETDDWFSVSPMSGFAGEEVELHITATESNEEFLEKEGKFTVLLGEKYVSYMVIQRGKAGLDIAATEYYAMGEGGDIVIPLGSTVPFIADVQSDWLSIKEIKSADSTVCGDLETLSKYVSHEVILTATANSGELREEVVTFVTDEGQIEEITVCQMGEMKPDFSKTFYRRTVGLRFTGTWCGYCPYMSEAFHIAKEKAPGRIANINLYQGSGSLSFDKVNTLMNHYGVQGFPSGYINDYAEIANAQAAANATNIVNLAEEAVASLPSKTNMGGVFTIDGDNAVVKLWLAAKEAGTYKVVVYLVENNITGVSQAGASKDYVHDGVARKVMTDLYGEEVVLSANALESKEYSISLPSAIKDENNLEVIAFVTYEGTFKGECGNSNVVYKNFGDVIDNAIMIPVGRFLPFLYEE